MSGKPWDRFSALFFVVADGKGSKSLFEPRMICLGVSYKCKSELKRRGRPGKG